MRKLFLLALLGLAGCQSSGGAVDRSSGLYVYTDAQGNLVTLQQQSEDPAPVAPSQGDATSNPEKQAIVPSPDDNLDEYRPSGAVDQELEDRENQRFVTYIDETGQLVSRPLDMGAERAAAKAAPAPYEALSADGFMETYRPLRADCCLHLLEDASQLEVGSESLITFDDNSPRMVGEGAYPAMVFELDSAVSSLTLNAFVKKKGYLAVELLWLDADGAPVMLVDQPFSRKYPETWYRYGYLQGTLGRDAGQHYLVVYLPYGEAQPGTDGLIQVTQGELVLLGR